MMILVFPILSVVAVVLTASFVLRQGLAAYREKKAIAVFALGVAIIAYVGANLAVRIAALEFIGTALKRSSDLEHWVVLHQAITTIQSLLPLAFIVYFVVLVRRDLAGSAVDRSRFRESASLAAFALLFVIVDLFRYV